MKRWVVCVGLLGCGVLLGCGEDKQGLSARVYRATITRTTYGVPHITADNWGDLGFGDGYAYGQDNYCLLMREVVAANGQTARYFGETEGKVADDFVYSHFNADAVIEEELLAAQTAQTLETLDGYAAGFNQYLTDTGSEGLSEDCRNAEWVRAITRLDLAKVMRKQILYASAQQLAAAIVDAAPPMESTARLAPSMSAPFDLRQLQPDPTAFGSNAYAIGADGSQTGVGLLLGNPHFPWEGGQRFYTHHLTIPGEVDVMGATLPGTPAVLIGFNANIAWSHTVSTGRRFAVYELTLLPDDPMKYEYDGEVRDITAVPVTIEVRADNGDIESRTQNLYFSHYGPILDGESLSPLLAGWPTFLGTVLTYRDANLTNTRPFDYWAAIDKAASIDDIEDASALLGNPWANTIAVDRSGEAFYADATVTPHITAEQYTTCADSIITQGVVGAGVPALNGSKSECAWGSDDDAPVEGILGYANLPKLRNSTYVGNSNDSYWLSNPDTLLTGFSPVIGREGVEQTLRTRLGFMQAEARMDASDGKSTTPGYNIELLQDMLYSNADLAEQLTRADVVTICNAVTDWTAGDCDLSEDVVRPYAVNVAEAASVCALIESWDGTYDVDSVGASVWREVWVILSAAPNLWAVPFDAADPVHTPRELNDQDPVVIEWARCAIGYAIDTLVAADIPLDRAWGDAQFRWNGDRSERIPIHGGNGQSSFSVINSQLVPGEGYSNIPQGNSYIQTVTWDDTQCPVAYSVLTYSQSSDPESPHYTDMTELYSEKGWNALPFCADAIADATISTLEVTNDDN